MTPTPESEWSFPFEESLHEVFPATRCWVRSCSTVPAFGMLAAVEAIPVARAGFDAAELPEED